MNAVNEPTARPELLAALLGKNGDCSLTHDMIQALPLPIYVTDAKGRILFYNETAADFWGRRPKLGEDHWCDSWRLFRTDGTPMAHDECPMAEALKTGQPVRGVEAMLERQDGTRAFFMPYPTPLRDEEGRIVGAINLLLNTAQGRQTEQAAQHLAAIVASSDDAIISKNLDSLIQTWNKGAERLFGYTAAEAVGRPVTMLIPDNMPDEEPGILARLRRGERIDHYETVRRRKDGMLVDVSLTVSPIRDADGRITGASKIARDITDSKRAEKTREMLLNEIKHRVKNTLAMVQAISSQTFRNAPREERDAFAARLRVLAQAHDLLTRRDWEQVAIEETLARALGPFQDSHSNRFRISGPQARLAADRALLLSMVVHELGTNAVKYGALSNAAGQVHVTWKVANGKMHLEWREEGGPPVSPPARKGFGSALIEKSLQQEKGRAQFLFAPAGVTCTMEMPL